MDQSSPRAVFYRVKAEQLRIVADTMKNPDARTCLLTAAENYEQMAEIVQGLWDAEAAAKADRFQPRRRS